MTLEHLEHTGEHGLGALARSGHLGGDALLTGLQVLQNYVADGETNAASSRPHALTSLHLPLKMLLTKVKTNNEKFTDC